MKNKLTIIGYIIFLFSCLIWGALFIIPWFGLSGSQLALYSTILIIAGEITFYLSLFLLGKNFWDKIKSKLKFWKSKENKEDLNEMV